MSLARIKPLLSPLTLLPLALVLAGALLTWQVDVSSRDDTRRQTERWLAAQQLGYTLVLEQRLALMQESARRLADARINSLQQFRHQATGFLEQYPDVRGVEVIRRIPDALRDLIEAQLSQEAQQPVRFRDWQSEATDDAAPESDQYLVVRWALARSTSGTTAGILADSVPLWRQELATTLSEQTLTATALASLELDGTPAQTIRLFVPASGNEVIAVAITPERWLGATLGGQLTAQLGVKVHDLTQHTKAPLFEYPLSGEALPAQTLRTEVRVGNRQWMVTTVPAHGLFQQATARSRQTIWLVGLASSAFAAILVAWLLAGRRRDQRQRALADQSRQQLTQRLDNIGVEKHILHQALAESGDRSRDLVRLVGGFVCELDEDLRIGFVSEPATDMLRIAVAELSGHSLLQRVAPSYRDNFIATLKAAREERQMQRIDLDLLGADDQPVPVTVRVLAQLHPVDGCTGYRLSAVPRHSPARED
ncbi:PAS domain-containing protein [Marinobacter xestospongiae]|uniref:PAS domain-containing protein n=1 Tax=Marinobacter xestospongiae TaxID=994319 RepID=UPI0020031E43|nr:PAS domain-containing protein [Marinobacter xestospongiae]MCK7566302.1 PAS domain-containing protein [Marinobacter xestospongiae]